MKLGVTLDILNQKATPAFYADTLANRPAAGFIGRIFVSTDTYAFYRDNGTGWDLIGGPGTGTITGSGIAGQVTFFNGTSSITGDSGLTYNDVTNALTSLGTIKATNYYVGTPSDLSRSFAARGDANSVALWLEEYGSTTASPDIFMFKGQGSSSTPSNVLVGDNTGGITTGGYVNGFLNGSTTLGTRVVNIDSTNNYANSDLVLEQTYNSISATENFRVRAIDGYVVASNGGFETTGNINLFAGANTRRIIFDANNGVPRIFSFRTGNLPRWAFRVDGTESGTNTGSDLAFRRYDDAGTFVDAPLSMNRASGQSTFAKKVVIENNTSDQQLQIVSTTAPSIRIDNLQTGATKRAGLGISTAVNNFIQGSVDRDFCIFNGSTTASPILFGVYDAGAGNIQEAARISSSRNLLLGTIIDNGSRLQVSGAGTFSSGITSTGTNTMLSASSSTAGLIVRGGSSIGTPSLSSGQILIGQTSTYRGSIAYDDNIGSMYIDNLYDNANSNIYIRTRTIGTPINALTILGSGNVGIGTTVPQSILDIRSTNIPRIQMVKNGIISWFLGDTTQNATNIFSIGTDSGANFRILNINNTGNVSIGTTTDNGNKLQVNGNSSINGGWRYLDFIGATTNFWECYHYNDNTFRMNYNGVGGDEFILTSGGNLEINFGYIKTGSPSGGTSQTWKLGNYTAGAAVQAGKVRVEINGVAYDLLTA